MLSIKSLLKRSYLRVRALIRSSRLFVQSSMAKTTDCLTTNYFVLRLCRIFGETRNKQQTGYFISDYEIAGGAPKNAQQKESQSKLKSSTAQRSMSSENVVFARPCMWLRKSLLAAIGRISGDVLSASPKSKTSRNTDKSESLFFVSANKNAPGVVSGGVVS